MVPRVFVITHDQLLASAYRARLMREQFAVECRSTAHAGLARARQWKPQIILLDVTLPGLHGLDVLKSLRDVPWLSQTHVVLLIERTLSRSILEECLLWGAGSFLHKDVCTLGEVVAHLRAILPSLDPAVLR